MIITDDNKTWNGEEEQEEEQEDIITIWKTGVHVEEGAFLFGDSKLDDSIKVLTFVR